MYFAISLSCYLHNTIKDPHRYVVQVSDTTMMTREPSAGTIKITGRHFMPDKFLKAGAAHIQTPHLITIHFFTELHIFSGFSGSIHILANGYKTG